MQLRFYVFSAAPAAGATPALVLGLGDGEGACEALLEGPLLRQLLGEDRGRAAKHSTNDQPCPWRAPAHQTPPYGFHMDMDGTLGFPTKLKFSSCFLRDSIVRSLLRFCPLLSGACFLGISFGDTRHLSTHWSKPIWSFSRTRIFTNSDHIPSQWDPISAGISRCTTGTVVKTPGESTRTIMHHHETT